MSNETMQPEVYVAPFPDPGRRHRVSTGGGIGGVAPLAVVVNWTAELGR